METITLKDFIKDTLIDITTGIREANHELHEAKKIPYTDVFILRHNIGDSSKILGIQFDVAVTATSNKEGKIGIKIGVASVGGHVGGGTEASNEMTQRIKFEVGINSKVF